MKAVNQKDVLAAAIGNPEYYRECNSIYPCGSPFETNVGTNLVSPPSIADAKKLLAEAGYKGEKTVILQPSDIPNSNAFALVVAKACRDIGMNVDLQALDWSSVTSRRAKKDPVDQGGWNMFPTWWIGGDLLNPLSNASLVADPNKAWPGWPTDPKLEELRAAFAGASGLAAQKKAAADVQQRAIEIGTAANLGIFFVPVGYRDNIKGMIPSPVQFFWNMEKVSA
jgi:peptide/nickel transport system substrate-binding protein